MKKFIKPIRIFIILNIIFSVISNIALALMPYYTQELLKSHYQNALIGYISCILIYLLFNYLQMRVEWKQAIKFSTLLKTEWFNSVISKSKYDFSKRKVPEYISYQSNDLDALEKDYLPPLISFYKQILRMIIFAIVITGTINIVVAIILITSAIVSIQIPKIIGKKTSQKRTKYLKNQSDYYKKLDDLLSGHHLINNKTLLGFKKQQQLSLEKLQSNYYDYGLMKTIGLVLTGFSFEFTGIILFIYLAYGLYNNQITVPEVAASLSYITAFSEPIQEILYDIQMLESVKKVKESFLSIINLKKVDKIGCRTFKKIIMKNIYKKIGNKNLNIPLLEINKGEKIALIGDNGSGKSTLLNIINGMDEDFEGDIYIDGEKINYLDGLFSMILQKDHTFYASYEENISIFSSYDIKQMKDIFSGQNASYLSGGEKQKMYLTRVINQNNPLILMDEPFSALDTVQFQNELSKVLNLDSAVIMILHQNDNMLEKFDTVWKIENGTIKILKMGAN
ncbi:ABC transporter ATP-binding protein [Macrococcus sp. FSL R5-0951]|uniref:ATP-binding cassette domain-containing protein n=1 Tax=Macrococcoides TaxID=3076173 RepID=UPI001C5FCC8E|nr:ABC transporter ATP-binding protein [Macrococcus bohemicus]QYA46054.1 ABC transporter ATP-binding protein/permease [Macrococcus bohemicus]